MIDSKTVKIKKNDVTLDNSAIENYLKMQGYNIIRWAVTSVDNEFIEISLSFKK